MFNIKLIPQNRKFFELFNDLSEVLTFIVREFIDFLKNYHQKDGYITKIIDLEQKGNRIAAELMVELSSNFVTPLDREDIHGLTKILNGIIDHVHGVARRFDMYNVDAIREPAILMSEVLLNCVEELELLINRLNNMSALEKITPAIDQLDKFEEKGDEIYRQAIKELFLKEADTPLEVLKWKDIYERIENNIDKCNDAGNIILGIILKYA